MTIAAIMAFISKFAAPAWNFISGPFLDFLKKNWKQITWTVFLLWVIMCLLSHCTGTIDPWGRHGSVKPDTVSVKRDTAWLYADTNAIFALYGFDTIADHVERLNDSVRKIQSIFRPTAPVFHLDSDCRDSLMALWANRELLTRTLEDCDSTYHDAIAIRTYIDSLRTDSIVVSAKIKVKGSLFGSPEFNYRYLAPYPVITNTITIKEPAPEPRRQIYIDGGIAPRLNFENIPQTVEGSLGIGFVNKKNLSIGIEAGISHRDYRAGIRLRKGFSVGK